MIIEKLHLEPDEIVLIHVRKHWFILLIQLVVLLCAGALPLLVYTLIEAGTTMLLIPPNSIGVLIALYTGWLLIIWMALFSVWTNYYLDIWTVTNKRLIAVDQKGFFTRSTASFRLERLQDIEVSVVGIVATLLDFGTLEIQTAGVEKNFKAYGLPKPGELKGIITGATDALLGKNATLGNSSL